MLASKIAPRTRAILLQHLYGLVCRDYDEILDLAKRHGLAVIEDCAHATGARHQGVRVGNRGDLAVYSSEQSKIFNTIQKFANTTAATIPIGMDEAVKAGKLKKGMLVASAAFGSGFTWASALIRW